MKIQGYRVKNSGSSYSGQHIVGLNGDIYTCVAGGSVIEYHKDEIELIGKEYRVITYEERMKVKKQIEELNLNLKDLDEKIKKIEIKRDEAKTDKQYDKVNELLFKECSKYEEIRAEIRSLGYSITPSW
jgi:hypothetical protein